MLQIGGRERQVNVSEVDGTDASANKKKGEERRCAEQLGIAQRAGKRAGLSWASKQSAS